MREKYTTVKNYMKFCLYIYNRLHFPYYYKSTNLCVIAPCCLIYIDLKLLKEHVFTQIFIVLSNHQCNYIEYLVSFHRILVIVPSNIWYHFVKYQLSFYQIFSVIPSNIWYRSIKYLVSFYQNFKIFSQLQVDFGILVVEDLHFILQISRAHQHHKELQTLVPIPFHFA